MSRGPAVQRLGAAVLVQHAAVLAEVRHLIAVGVRERQRRDALPPTATLRELLALLSEAIAAEQLEMTRPRHDDVAHAAALKHSERESSKWLEEIPIAQAATILGVGQRQAQRLARVIGARRVPGGALVLDRGAVEAYSAQRRERRKTP